jgi:hypothetical protein
MLADPRTALHVPHLEPFLLAAGLHHARALLLAQHGGRGKEALRIWRQLGAHSHELHRQLGAGSHDLHQHLGVPEIIHYFTTLVGGIWVSGQREIDAAKWALVTEFSPWVMDACANSEALLEIFLPKANAEREGEEGGRQEEEEEGGQAKAPNGHTCIDDKAPKGQACAKGQTSIDDTKGQTSIDDTKGQTDIDVCRSAKAQTSGEVQTSIEAQTSMNDKDVAVQTSIDDKDVAAFLRQHNLVLYVKFLEARVWGRAYLWRRRRRRRRRLRRVLCKAWNRVGKSLLVSSCRFPSPRPRQRRWRRRRRRRRRRSNRQ